MKKIVQFKIVGRYKDGGTIAIDYTLDDGTKNRCFLCNALGSQNVEKRGRLYKDLQFNERVEYDIDKQLKGVIK